MNILGGAENWPQLQALVRARLEEANLDLVALQETVVDGRHDQTFSLLDHGYIQVHQKRRGPQDLGCRWPRVGQSSPVTRLIGWSPRGLIRRTGLALCSRSWLKHRNPSDR
jgi:hypothetical protein